MEITTTKDKSAKVTWCRDCETEWENYCPLCKMCAWRKPAPQRREILPVGKKQKAAKEPVSNKSAKQPPPTQEVPVTVDNFFVASYGIFTEIKEIPTDFIHFFKSKKSEYYTNEDKTKLIRVSDHWGYNIRFCSWHLRSYKKISSFKWVKTHGKTPKIGIIDFCKLMPNPAYQNTQKAEIESRHPY